MSGLREGCSPAREDGSMKAGTMSCLLTVFLTSDIGGWERFDSGCSRDEADYLG